METSNALKPVNKEQISSLSRRDLIDFFIGEQDLRLQYEKKLVEYERKIAETEDEVFELNDKYLRIKNLIFSPSSEKSKDITKQPKPASSSGDKKKKKQKPSERYPNAEVKETVVDQVPAPVCQCGQSMTPSGLYEESESLTVIPKKFLINRQFLTKYRCNCCSGNGLITTPPPPRIKPGSAYSDAMIIDVALSKYCDLIPIERYCMMAARQGLVGLPQNSLIELTHYLASFLEPVADLITKEVLSSSVIHADETPHKMLESVKKNWYLWGFSSDRACFFQVKNSRSGDVAWEILEKSTCKILVSDVYSGYAKAVRLANEERLKENQIPIRSSYCNAHARRKFKEISGNEGEFFLECYREIYRLESKVKNRGKKAKKRARHKMKPIFAKMRKQAKKLLIDFSAKSSQARAANYFLDNYEGLTLCLRHFRVNLDNNRQESLFRNPVVGRKIWYGNHSLLGAKTSATLHTLTESCKLVKVNPRIYFPAIVKALHEKKPPFTPSQFAKMLADTGPPKTKISQIHRE